MPLPRVIPARLLQEGEQALRLCNACRYCEGFCAVFPAMERRTAFSEQDLNYLANLCHDCGECLYSCQYAPPHEFALHLPRTLAAIRTESYHKYAWPAAFSGLFRNTRLAVLLSVVAIPALFVLLTLLAAGPSRFFAAHSVAEGSFYAVIPHAVMVTMFGIAGLFALIALKAGVAAFWKDLGEPWRALLSPRALRQAAWEALRLRYLDGGGDGCTYPGEVQSNARRRFHHLTFYGFLLCFASTSVAAFYHNVLGWTAPYPLLSLPVVLGTLGGFGLLIGPAGLLWLKRARDVERAAGAQDAMDTAFLLLLFLTGLTGLLLLLLRETAAMALTLTIHLGLVLGLFVTMPYGKFVHGFYRFAALVRNVQEQRRAAAGPGPG